MTDRQFSWGAFIAGACIILASSLTGALDAYAAIEAKQALHTSHLALCFGGALFGIVVAFSPWVLPTIKALLADAQGTRLPFVGGGRDDADHH